MMCAFNINFTNLTDIQYEHLFKTVISTHEYVFFKDTQGRFTYLNDALLAAFNEEKLEDAIGKSDYDYYPKEFADVAYEDEQNIIHKRIFLLDKEEKLFQPNGRITWYKVSKYPLLSTSGEIIGVWGMSSNIDNQKRIEHQLENANRKLLESKNAYQTKSEIDQTTGIKNKRRMYDDFKSKMKSYTHSNRQEDVFCIAFLDLDDFKNVNDTYGHNTGDFVLRQVALLFESAVRPIDAVYRFGGDEFIICYKSMSIEQSLSATKRIIKIISSHTFNIENHKFISSISGGVASCEEANTIEGLINLADTRLYKAKNSGKNTVI